MTNHHSMNQCYLINLDNFDWFFLGYKKLYISKDPCIAFCEILGGLEYKLSREKHVLYLLKNLLMHERDGNYGGVLYIFSKNSIR